MLPYHTEQVEQIPVSFALLVRGATCLLADGGQIVSTIQSSGSVPEGWLEVSPSESVTLHSRRGLRCIPTIGLRMRMKDKLRLLVFMFFNLTIPQFVASQSMTRSCSSVVRRSSAGSVQRDFRYSPLPRSGP